ncbi:aldehyde dehydrogenase [Longimycelium tulufanense]|uniref:Aldehyde dehydrogenase n=1 Tax=Longimycelium tulufanense TaxID=907463 RepID=A0A8J3FS63_9PSEU|nr:aldehyde dehydrogenase family protein [Longimycelium tulufanense]GGM33795.1 aldehyde dehydrogenase [Longimycelium tulufanense]
MTTVTAPPELVHVDALGPNGAFRARNRITVNDVAGDPTVELSLVPRLFVRRSLAALHAAGTMPADERAAALARAGRIFVDDAVDGLPFDRYVYLVSRISGMPISVVREAAQGIGRAAVETYRAAYCARPTAAVTDWRDPRTHRGAAVWTRRGDVFAVHAAGNHPGVHTLWLEALALGYRVAVRPSQREPLTPHRLILALRAAGFGEDQVVLLPTDHDVADDIIDGADLAMVYGGDAVVNKYGHSARVLPQGPGRSKILVTGDAWRDHLDMIVESVSSRGATACVNTTAVLVEGDPAPLAEALADRLATMPSLPPEDEKAALPVHPVASARALEQFLLARADGATAWLGGDGVVEELGDGSAVLRPAVHQVDRADAPQIGVELPFPCVWVAPWSYEDGIAPLRNTLVLTAVTDDAALVDRLLQEPTITNVYLGDTPTVFLEPGIPHDAYLGEFLMRTKAVARTV